jgi:hypothetical protein
MVVDLRSLAMLESESWSEILDVLAARYLSVYDEENPSRPNWLDQREELSNLALSMSTQPMNAVEMRAIASKLSAEHSFGESCKDWAMCEAKWILQYLLKASTLMGGFMALPEELKLNPGIPAPVGHIHPGIPMRVAMTHAAFLVLASSRRVKQIEEVANQEHEEGDFIVHEDGSVSRSKNIEQGGSKPLSLGNVSSSTSDPAFEVAK